MNTPAKSNALTPQQRRLALQMAAVNTPDMIGLILRLHLATEVLLDEYIALERADDRGEFVLNGRFFGDKLSTAVAFGLPVPLARVCKELNRMRNEVAHPNSADHGISPAAVGAFARTVDKLKIFAASEDGVGDFISPLDHLKISSSERTPGTSYRDKGDAMDLLIAYLAFDNQLSMFLQARTHQLTLARDLKKKR